MNHCARPVEVEPTPERRRPWETPTLRAIPLEVGTEGAKGFVSFEFSTFNGPS
jgi:hypothetical protein